MASFSAMKLNLYPNPPSPEYLRRGNSRMMAAWFCSSTSDPRRRVNNIKVKAIKFKGTQRREQQLTEMIEQKVMEAEQVCGEDETSDECKVAWDEVEEVSQAKAHLRLKLEIDKQDPLESFCQENPETDECRIYED